MGGGSLAREHPWDYLGASALSATINYPLWRASAVGQSGFRVLASSVPGVLSGVVPHVPPSVAPLLYAFAPPYRGLSATILGMTWARAAIFWGSDRGKDLLRENFPGMHPGMSTVLPPLAVSTMVQIVNQPIVRASITLQNPETDLRTIRQSLRFIYVNHGLGGMWHGTSAGILKTVPKYCTAVVIKDLMEEILPPVDTSSPSAERDALWRSAYKSSAAGLAGAALTNPLDVIRNEMFKTNHGLRETVRNLRESLGWRFMIRGIGKNMVAVAIPVSCTIFFTDALIQFSKRRKGDKLLAH
uniref:Mitochondrial carrier protein n=1 Tax=Odontella aurita TaxID=265563 RepID=A0A7S4KCS5_9STRA|mmetsp:Transcript_9563/g.28703  ORF Transcript_9563/g.28703 Transcript_9563/m.28703 type:complete len:300 (+) Transcript_9563:235-1134(+)|eukprot:CAMPEP_0113554578 /NCGR_PEP_ID=MMETSP0015_2-20120614/16230_1 /TAXON_ID=2838 /ORGANISM="Odontella" /LENGTH=299 /DNA_ID=CAMNT_0000455741 /DNA_START=230 /DNA_END=1129 /DNA_ORIENTATION=+ /assembly_acc=CAM_ASM_000160